MARQQRQEADPPHADRPEGVVVEQPPEGKPTAASKKKDTGDPELKAIGRVVRMLNALTPEAQQRVGVYLASRYERKVAT